MQAALQSGFTHKAWINPSEVLADHIFCGHGGFAFLSHDDGRAEYFPVIKSTFDADEETHQYKPEPYDMCLFGLQTPCDTIPPSHAALSGHCCTGVSLMSDVEWLVLCGLC